MATEPNPTCCTATTQRGTPCSRPAMHGHTTCLAHAPQEVKDSKGFGGSQPGAGRPRTPRAVDVLRERIENDIDRVLDPLWNALEADRGLALALKGGGMEIGYSPDHQTRIQAARELLDRAYGRPKQSTEVSGPDGGPVEVLEIPVDATERSARAAKLLAEYGHTA